MGSAGQGAGEGRVRVEGGASRNLFSFGHERVIERGRHTAGDTSPQEPAR
jgi:hypothetical protein